MFSKPLLKGLLLLMLVAPTAQAVRIGFSVPEMLSVSVEKPLMPQVSLGVGVGYFPASFFVAMLVKPLTFDWSSMYQISTRPRPEVWSTFVYADVRPWQSQFLLRMILGVSLIYGTGDLGFEEIGTGSTTNIGQVEAFLVWPSVSLRMVWELGQKASEGWDIQAGISFFFSPRLKSNLNGSVASYLELYPGDAESTQEGLQEFQTNLEDSLRAVYSKVTILPSISVGYSF